MITVAIVRLGNKRLFGKGTAFDLVVAIMIGSVMSRAITNASALLATWLAGLVLVGMHWLLATLSYHLDWFGPLVKGHPVLLVKDGEIQRDGMQEGGVSRADLEQAFRAQGNDPDPSRVRRAYLGIAGGPRPVPPQARRLAGGDSCVEVVEVVDGSPADRADIRAEDLILAVNGTPVTRVEDLQRLMVADLIGVPVTVRLLRAGRPLDVELIPAELG